MSRGGKLWPKADSNQGQTSKQSSSIGDGPITIFSSVDPWSKEEENLNICIHPNLSTQFNIFCFCS